MSWPPAFAAPSSSTVGTCSTPATCAMAAGRSSRSVALRPDMAAGTPTVSVVIPTKNRPDLLRNALDSVLAQTFADYEIIVVVDGPDPATEELLRAEPDPRLRFHVG